MNVLVAVAAAEAVNVSVILSRRLFCFDFGIKKSLWLPRCCCFEKETGEEKEKETETETGEGKWMALLRDLIEAEVVAVAEAVNVPTIVEVEVEVEVGGAGVVLMADLMVVLLEMRS